LKKILITITIIALALVAVGCVSNDKKTETGEKPGTTEPPKPKGKQTMVAKGQTPEDHVKEYFEAYKNDDLKKAFDMSPAENKAAQPEDDFITLRKGMPIAEYKILPTEEQGNEKIIAVEYDIGQYGTWVSTWLFEENGGKWTAVRYKASPKG